MYDYLPLIRNLPVRDQGFTAKKKTWQKHIYAGGYSGKCLQYLFDGNDTVTITRKDLFQYGMSGFIADDYVFIMAVILWGYPRGMRGNNFLRVRENLPKIQELLRAAREDGIHDWYEHWAEVKKIPGLGISTYSKLLHFARVKVEGLNAYILDAKVIDAIQLYKEEFKEIQHINDNVVAGTSYPAYLYRMAEIQIAWVVNPENIELFLFMFAQCLRPSTAPHTL